ncbi:large ribosomal subunit protein bL19m [Centruroides vittatus]|uniref:large ribosomal subunit protein bL19m n=1 Tax=Centruroides vittatus TaxID=120091 RepID=UPI00350F3624
MAASRHKILALFLTLRRSRNYLFTKIGSNGFNYSTAIPDINKEEQKNLPEKSENKVSVPDFKTLAEYRYIYPEFLPNPQRNRRHKIRESLERMDMLKRRSVLEIPEFYVGSILAVTVCEPWSPGKTNRFVGICIMREGHGLRASFILRNVVDHLGVEIRYDLYNPTIQKIEVLKLEKRLDFHLVYLRDAAPEYSTFPFDMEAETRTEGTPVPINPMKVKLKPLPWYAHWERFELKGIEYELSELDYRKAKRHEKPWEKFDLMKEYREHVPEEHQKEIWEEVHRHHVSQSQKQKKERRKKQLLKARDN